MTIFLRRLPLSLISQTKILGVVPSPVESCHYSAIGRISTWKSRFHTSVIALGAASPSLKETALDTISDEIDPTKPADYNPSNFDASESRSPPAEKIIKIVDKIANMTLIEASDLSYLLKKKLGLPDSAMPYYGGMGGQIGSSAPDLAAKEEEKIPEKTNFDIRLEKFDASAKIKVIKEVRTFTSLGLKEAKELVEKLPAMIKKGVGKEEADQIVEKLKAIGATAVLE